MVWLDVAKVVAIIAVVVFHTTGELLNAGEIHTSAWWVGNLTMASVRWCVPVFVMISGALLLDPTKTEPLNTFYRKRLSRVLLPLLFWSIFYMGWIWYKGAIQNKPPSTISMVRLIIEGKTYYHMWFLFMILGLYFFTPFFRKVIAHTSVRDLWVLVISLLALVLADSLLSSVITMRDELTSPPPPFVTMSLPYIPYFFLGYLIRFQSPQPPRWLMVLVFGVAMALCASGQYLGRHLELPALASYAYSNVGLCVMAMAIAVMYLLKGSRWPIFSAAFTRTLALLTLGVYLIHPIILECFIRNGLGIQTLKTPWWLPVLATLVTVTSFFLSWLILKIPLLRKVI